MLRLLGALALAPCLVGCTSTDYSQLPAGEFSGSLFVMWLGEGGPSGDGLFLYVPDPERPLTFRRRDPRGRGAVIRPGLMYTDGGSIPRIAQIFRGLSPWGYAPAYMIHDWLFVARHCIVDGDTDPRFADLRDVTFEDSAEILGEAIQTLVAEHRVRRNDVAGSAVTGAVGSLVARNLWDARGACAPLRVTPEHAAAARAALPGVSSARARQTFRLPEGATAEPTPQTVPARVISRVSF